MPTLRCAFSPDADDRFMFRAIELGLIDTEGLNFVLEAKDTEGLNVLASADDGPDITAISIAHYPAIADRYLLLPHGGSVGRGYGPVVITRSGLGPDLRGKRIAVPGETTTACLTLRLLLGATPASPVFIPLTVPISPPSLTFDTLRRADVDAALVIHEGRLTYADEGFSLMMDLGVTWAERTTLPLPLGGNVIHRRLPIAVRDRANRVLKRSIAHALANQADAVAWLMERPGPLQHAAQVAHYLSLYANADTLDYGDDGRAGIQYLLDAGAKAGWLAPCVAEFA